jgi:hypothetical protein
MANDMLLGFGIGIPLAGIILLCFFRGRYVREILCRLSFKNQKGKRQSSTQYACAHEQPLIKSERNGAEPNESNASEILRLREEVLKLRADIQQQKLQPPQSKTIAISRSTHIQQKHQAVPAVAVAEVASSVAAAKATAVS